MVDPTKTKQTFSLQISLYLDISEVLSNVSVTVKKESLTWLLTNGFVWLWEAFYILFYSVVLSLSNSMSLSLHLSLSLPSVLVLLFSMSLFLSLSILVKVTLGGFTQLESYTSLTYQYKPRSIECFKWLIYTI